MSDWMDLNVAWTKGVEVALEYGTKALAGLTVVLLGVLLARLLDKIVATLIRKSGFEALMEKLDLSRFLYRVGLHMGFSAAFGRMTRYIIYVVTAFVAVDVMGIEAFANFRDQFLAFVPRGLSGLAMFIGGLLLADLARTFSVAALRSSEIVESPEHIGKIVQAIVLLLVVAMTAEQVGLEIQLIRQILLVVLASAGLALGLGAGFGGQSVFRNLVSRPYVEQALQLGTDVTSDGVHVGKLKAFAAQSAVFVDADGNERWIPYSDFLQKPFTVHTNQ